MYDVSKKLVKELIEVRVWRRCGAMRVVGLLLLDGHSTMIVLSGLMIDPKPSAGLLVQLDTNNSF